MFSSILGRAARLVHLDTLRADIWIHCRTGGVCRKARLTSCNVIMDIAADFDFSIWRVPNTLPENLALYLIVGREMMQPPEHVRKVLTALPDPSRLYFAVRVLLGEDGKLRHWCYSHWVGYTDESHRVELRAASIINADRLVETWRQRGETAAVVDTVDDMNSFLLFGGNAVIDKGVAEAVIGHWLKPTPSVQVGEYGFVSVTDLSPGSFNRAPAAKTRMRVLKRDSLRCRICGRSPNDDVDLELHVHHIRPWGRGGVSAEENLITICHTCHKGLDPHFDPSLFSLVEPFFADETERRRRTEYWEGLLRYVEKVKEMVDLEIKAQTHSGLTRTSTRTRGKRRR